MLPERRRTHLWGEAISCLIGASASLRLCYQVLQQSSLKSLKNRRFHIYDLYMNAIYNPVYTVYIRHIYTHARACAFLFKRAQKKKRPSQAVKRPFFGKRGTLHPTKRSGADGTAKARERVQGARYKHAQKHGRVVCMTFGK